MYVLEEDKDSGLLCTNVRVYGGRLVTPEGGQELERENQGELPAWYSMPLDELVGVLVLMARRTTAGTSLPVSVLVHMPGHFECIAFDGVARDWDAIYLKLDGEREEEVLRRKKEHDQKQQQLQLDREQQQLQQQQQSVEALLPTDAQAPISALGADLIRRIFAACGSPLHAAAPVRFAMAGRFFLVVCFPQVQELRGEHHGIASLFLDRRIPRWPLATTDKAGRPVDVTLFADFLEYAAFQLPRWPLREPTFSGLAAATQWDWMAHLLDDVHLASINRLLPHLVHLVALDLYAVVQLWHKGFECWYTDDPPRTRFLRHGHADVLGEGVDGPTRKASTTLTMATLLSDLPPGSLPALRCLHLNHLQSGSTEAGARALADSLLRNSMSMLRDVTLAYAGIGEEGIRILLPALLGQRANHQPSLVRLICLPGNCFSGESFFDELFSVTIPCTARAQLLGIDLGSSTLTIPTAWRLLDVFLRTDLSALQDLRIDHRAIENASAALGTEDEPAPLINMGLRLVDVLCDARTQQLPEDLAFQVKFRESAFTGVHFTWRYPDELNQIPYHSVESSAGISGIKGEDITLRGTFASAALVGSRHADRLPSNVSDFLRKARACVIAEGNRGRLRGDCFYPCAHGWDTPPGMPDTFTAGGMPDTSKCPQPTVAYRLASLQACLTMPLTASVQNCWVEDHLCLSDGDDMLRVVNPTDSSRALMKEITVSHPLETNHHLLATKQADAAIELCMELRDGTSGSGPSLPASYQLLSVALRMERTGHACRLRTPLERRVYALAAVLTAHGEQSERRMNDVCLSDGEGDAQDDQPYQPPAKATVAGLDKLLQSLCTPVSFPGGIIQAYQREYDVLLRDITPSTFERVMRGSGLWPGGGSSVPVMPTVSGMIDGSWEKAQRKKAQGRKATIAGSGKKPGGLRPGGSGASGNQGLGGASQGGSTNGNGGNEGGSGGSEGGAPPDPAGNGGGREAGVETISSQGSVEGPQGVWLVRHVEPTKFLTGVLRGKPAKYPCIKATEKEKTLANTVTMEVGPFALGYEPFTPCPEGAAGSGSSDSPTAPLSPFAVADSGKNGGMWVPTSGYARNDTVSAQCLRGVLDKEGDYFTWTACDDVNGVDVVKFARSDVWQIVAWPFVTSGEDTPANQEHAELLAGGFQVTRGDRKPSLCFAFSDVKLIAYMQTSVWQDDAALRKANKRDLLREAKRRMVHVVNEKEILKGPIADLLIGSLPLRLQPPTAQQQQHHGVPLRAPDRPPRPPNSSGCYLLYSILRRGGNSQHSLSKDVDQALRNLQEHAAQSLATVATSLPSACFGTCARKEAERFLVLNVGPTALLEATSERAGKGKAVGQAADANRVFYSGSAQEGGYTFNGGSCTMHSLALGQAGVCSPTSDASETKFNYSPITSRDTGVLEGGFVFGPADVDQVIKWSSGPRETGAHGRPLAGLITFKSVPWQDGSVGSAALAIVHEVWMHPCTPIIRFD